MTRGSVPAKRELTPRILIEPPLEPGAPDPPRSWRPGTVPARVLVTLVATCFARSSDFTTAAAPVNDSFFCVPKATTMTSSSTSLLGDNSIVMFFLMEAVCFSIPTKETVTVLAFSATLREKLPSMSVTVPVVVPVTTTDAPMIGSPSSLEMTRPVMVLVCAIIIVTPKNRHTITERSFFILVTFD